MKKNKNISIYCDGGKNIGYGHIRRSLVLYYFLKNKNYKTNILPLSNFPKKFLPLEHNKKIAQLVIFDGPINNSNEKLLKKLRKEQKKIITLDWFGKFIPDINIAIYPHKKVKAKVKSYIGLNYVIIDKKIINIKKNRKYRNIKNNKNIMNKVLIMIGGGDILGLGKKASKYLNNCGFKVTLIEGPLVKNKLVSKNINVLCNPKNLNQLMIKNDWIITNGGNSLFESIFLKKPTYVLPQSNNEIKIAKLFYRNKMIFGFGKKINKFPTEKKFKNFFKRKKSIIDGYGASRIFKIINKAL